VPALAFLVTAKPNVGLASLSPHLRPRAAITCAVAIVAILALSFAVRPDWLGAWRSAIANAPHVVAPIMRPFGFLLVLAALKWRRADARLLLVMSCVPHTPSLYDLVPLFFVCRTLRETLVLALLTHAIFWGNVVFGSYNTFDAYAEGLGRAIVAVVYLPVLVAILFRPNREDAPAPPKSLSWRTILPSNHVDHTLLGVLIVAGFFLTWLPLVTYR
jgi:hypothetical protein